MGWRLPFVQQLVTGCDCNVIMVDYRGYGMSEGSPSEEVRQRVAPVLAGWSLHR